MRGLVAILVTGCSFHPGSPPVTPPSDAPADVAGDTGMPDMAVTRNCAVGVTSATGTDRGRVGGDGGGDNFPPLECAPPDRLVGIALRMSLQNTLYGERSAHGIRIACAPVAINAGVGTTGTITTFDVSGTGTYDWTPSEWTPITQCKPGWIMSGLSAHTTSDNDLFIDASIRCSQLDVMAATVATETLYVQGSLDEQQGADAVSCNAGEIIVRISNRTGAGVDSVNLWCTTPQCL